MKNRLEEKHDDIKKEQNKDQKKNQKKKNGHFEIKKDPFFKEIEAQNEEKMLHLSKLEEEKARISGIKSQIKEMERAMKKLPEKKQAEYKEKIDDLKTQLIPRNVEKPRAKKPTNKPTNNR